MLGNPIAVTLPMNESRTIRPRGEEHKVQHRTTQLHKHSPPGRNALTVDLPARWNILVRMRKRSGSGVRLTEATIK